MNIALAIVAAVALERGGELLYAERNTRMLRSRGAKEVGREHYPLIVLLHAAWLVSLVVFLPRDFVLHPVWIAIFAVLQVLRIWILVSLGPYWTTRILTLDDAPLVRTGPYRFLRHPNYVVVVGEIATLPLAFGEIVVAIVFSILNAGVLALRIAAEERALSARRSL
ncbi:MAG TPA: isoprenylcysteine carboxylmethyltransferase family protein [Rhizomicrobium sp.]|jgi:methyltransferase